MHAGPLFNLFRKEHFSPHPDGKKGYKEAERALQAQHQEIKCGSVVLVRSVQFSVSFVLV